MSRFAGLLGLCLACVGGGVAAVLAAGVLAAPAGAAPALSATDPCPHASAPVDEASAGDLRQAVVCLANRARAREGVDPLTRNHRLTLAAQRHTRRMLAQDCFEHHCDGEAILAHRLRHSGYLDGAESWRYAEVLGYDPSAKEMVTDWLAEDDEAADLLSTKYDQVGIGVKPGAPKPGGDDSGYATYTLDLGWRRPAP